MPIYEYECGACSHTFEAFQKMVDDPLKDCPECEKTALKKLISASAFRLKGDGWYETDFKTGSKKNLAGNEKAQSGDKPKPDDKAKLADKPAPASKSESKAK